MQNTTLYDLDILPKPHTGKACLWDKLNYCRTEGGKSELKKLLEPEGLSLKTVQDRQDAIRYICGKGEGLQLVITDNEVYYMQHYLSSNYSVDETRTKLMLAVKSYVKLVAAKSDYLYILSGIKQTLQIIGHIRSVYEQLWGSNVPELLKELLRGTGERLAKLQVSHANTVLNGEPNPVMLYTTDRLLRLQRQQELADLLELYYRLEALCSLARAHREMRLVFPKTGGVLDVRGLYHPLVANCAGNDLALNGEHVLLVTGPNMAGKSTFLKSIGIMFVLAYAGMGVPAEAAVIPFFKHIVTSINTEDDTAQGYSYFYAEVKKVKDIATLLRTNDTTLVIADELFKGTNVKDAGDCTETVIKGMLKQKNALVILATHLTETVGLFGKEPGCKLLCFDGAMRGNNEIDFDYRVRQGISTTRLGKHIMQREGIPALLGIEEG
ncbi:MAG: hypothetical protein K8F30_00715 [Taibaiella sp.]|nr:hypothetical protein [Taibaiella sp.]